MNILAYADRISVLPGEPIEIKASCNNPLDYQATLVRIIQGDVNPEGPGYQEQVVPLNLGGPYAGRFQPIHPGSFARVDDCPALDSIRSFCIAACVWPTLPGHDEQVLVSRRNPHTGAGFEFGLDGAGALKIELMQAGEQPIVLSTETPLNAHRWYAVCCGYDTATGKLQLRQQPLHLLQPAGDAVDVVDHVQPGIAQAGVDAPLLIAAKPGVSGPGANHFNGRIDNPRIFDGVPDMHDLFALMDDAPVGRMIACWDFSIDVSSERISDQSPNQLHGQLFNLPTRGVTGRRWTGEVHQWNECPAHYSAIHFHDDDLYDAGWQTDFSVEIPGDLASGLYGIRLHHDQDVFYVPFCVRPGPGDRRQPVALLLPTASYMAYANNRIGLDVPETELVCGRLIQLTEEDLYMQEHPEIGLSVYDLHNDGSGVFYTSRLRPVINMQPGHIAKLGGRGSNVWQFNADTHITGWLEQINRPFDVITDEDLHREGIGLLQNYRVIITGSHPEYHTLQMMQALQGYTEYGGRLMYLGGNGFYWRVAYHPELPGVLECRKSETGIRAFPPRAGEFYASFTGEYTGLWRNNGHPPNLLVGVGMASQGFDVSSPYRRSADSYSADVNFIFDGVEGDVIGGFGLSGGGAAGLEVDCVDFAKGTPYHLRVLASSERHTDLYLMTPEDLYDPVPGIGGTEADIIRADMVFFESNNGGAVFSTGSIAWAGSMAWNNYDNEVAKITANVLTRFLDETPF